MSFTYHFTPSIPPRPEIVSERIGLETNRVCKHVEVNWKAKPPCVNVTLDQEATGEDLAALEAIIADPSETLDQLKSKRVKAVALLTERYVRDRYPSYELPYYNALLSHAYANGLTNRATYIEALLDWVVSISTNYYDVKRAAIVAATDKAGVEALTFTYDEIASAFDETDPGTSLAGARQIVD
jgi:hypothetical protein